MYHLNFEKRGGCGVVARERQESRMSQLGEPLAKAKQLKISPLFKILTVQLNSILFKNLYSKTFKAKKSNLSWFDGKSY